VFLTGSVQLRSDMTLHLAGGAVLRGSPRLSDYVRYALNANGERGDANPDDRLVGDRGVLHALGVSNLVIDGPGTIDGAGEHFWPDSNNRPTFSLDLRDCSNVRIRDVTFLNPATYHVRTTACSDVVFDSLTVRAPPLAPNSDGLQIRDSSDIRISNCLIETGNDAIVLKSRERSVERVTISNCCIASDDAAIKFGTGSAVAIRDIVVSNVIVTQSRYGMALFMQDGEVYENARFSDIIIETGGRHTREYPIFVDIDTRRDPTAPLGVIRAITFDIRTSGNILIAGQAGAPVRDITLSNIRMAVSEGTDLVQSTGKPRGNRTHGPSQLADFSSESAHIVIGHAERVRLRGVDVHNSDEYSRRRELIVRRSADIVTR